MTETMAIGRAAVGEIVADASDTITLLGGTFSGALSRDGKIQAVIVLKVEVRWVSLSGAGAAAGAIPGVTM